MSDAKSLKTWAEAKAGQRGGTLIGHAHEDPNHPSKHAERADAAAKSADHKGEVKHREAHVVALKKDHDALKGEERRHSQDRIQSAENALKTARDKVKASADPKADLANRYARDAHEHHEAASKTKSKDDRSAHLLKASESHKEAAAAFKQAGHTSLSEHHGIEAHKADARAARLGGNAHLSRVANAASQKAKESGTLNDHNAAKMANAKASSAYGLAPEGKAHERKRAEHAAAEHDIRSRIGAGASEMGAKAKAATDKANVDGTSAKSHREAAEAHRKAAASTLEVSKAKEHIAKAREHDSLADEYARDDQGRFASK